ncbi:MAG: TrkA family potassium uptake protein, partial [Lachnospiraceae bacterium]|nr:TrkA family potassium uptake protein [Lachnospiraceae bacterium]
MQRKEFAILGLGRFGVSLAKSLAEEGCEVMAVDKNEDVVNEVVEYVMHAEIGDITNKDFVASLGLSNYDGVIIGVGDDLSAGVMATILAKEERAELVIAKAGSELQARVLRKVGADKVIFPEKEIGQRIARQLVHGNYFDAIGLSSTHSILE